MVIFPVFLRILQYVIIPLQFVADYKGEMTFTLSFKIHSIFGRKYYFLETFSHNKLLHNSIYRQFLILLFTSNIY